MAKVKPRTPAAKKMTVMVAVKLTPGEHKRLLKVQKHFGDVYTAQIARRLIILGIEEHEEALIGDPILKENAF